jgi:hypothetical protein
MSRIININGSSSERNKMLRSIRTAVDVLLNEQPDENETKNIVTYIMLSLKSITKSVDKTIVAWEKRDYWVKADRFRLDWEWVNTYYQQLLGLVKADNWDEAAQTARQLQRHLQNISPYKHTKKSTYPWSDAYRELD